MGQINNIDAKTLLKWQQNDEAVILDVREVVENKICAIKGSQNIPLSKVTLQTACLPEHKGKKIVIHCKGGKRSMMACEKLIAQGIDEAIYNLEGGIDAWIAAGNSVIRQKNMLPLERQVHLVISIMILTGLAAHHLTFNELYLLLPLVAGVGLLNSSLTGCCTMARLIAKMPWNK